MPKRFFDMVYKSYKFGVLYKGETVYVPDLL